MCEATPLWVRQNRRIASYALNQDAVEHAKRLIDAHQYVLRSRWQNGQPRARQQNAFLKTHAFADYALWHLGLTDGADDETKARYAFVYGDFRRLHRMGLIACHYRAAEWRHKEIELAAHELPPVPGREELAAAMTTYDRPTPIAVASAARVRPPPCPRGLAATH